MRCITVPIVTHLARTSAVSAIASILRGAGLDGVFLLRETEPGVVELSHNTRRESTLHIRTDLFEARRALERAGYEPFQVGSSIVARKVGPADPRPSLAKASWEDDDTDAGVEGLESPRAAKARVA